MKDADKSSDLYSKAKAAIINQADSMVKNVSASSYGSSITKYNWGSNMTIANSGIILGLADQLTGNNKYMNAANAQLDYLLGTNPVATCFVSGYGTVSPENPHHRPSMAVGHAMKGMLAGGVNQNLEDSAAKAYCQDQPAAKRYIDNAESYSTNEITIYWNSPLTYLLSITDNSDAAAPENNDVTLYGDANNDTQVDMADVVLIMQALSNPNKYGLDGTDEHHITKQGLANADVSNKGDGITSADALEIQRYLLGLVSDLSK
jgi:endoglucanase